MSSWRLQKCRSAPPMGQSSSRKDFISYSWLSRICQTVIISRSVFLTSHVYNVYIVLTLLTNDKLLTLVILSLSLSLGQKLHLAEGTSQSLEQHFGTIFRPICDSTRSHCCHLDKNWNSICFWAMSASEEFWSRAIQMFALLLLLLCENSSLFWLRWLK